jgi:hypothetical protein
MREITFFTFSSDRPSEVNQIVFGIRGSFPDIYPWIDTSRTSS